MPTDISTIKLREKNKLLNFKERKENLPIINSFPLVAKIEVTNRCNLSCIMCRDQNDSRKLKNLDVNIFHKLEPVFPYLLSAYLYGVGEVLTYPHASELFHSLLKYEINVGFITNGVLITEALARDWVENGLYKLSVSIDGAHKETYEKIRRGASFEKVLNNISQVRDLKKKLGVDRPIITFNFVSMKDTLPELPEYIKLAKEYGADEVIVNDLIVFFDEMKDQAVPYSDPLCYENFEEARKKANEVGLKLALPAPYSFSRRKTEEKQTIVNKDSQCIMNPCTEPWSGFWLTADGIVTPCCYWDIPMGDLKKASFLEIWNNEKYQHLRETVNTDKRSLHCRHCAISGMIQRK